MSSHLNSNTSFVKIPQPLLFLYPHIPEYKAEYTALYGLIVHYYNAEKDCAWPNVDTLAMYYGKSVKTTSEHLAVLHDVGLIDRWKAGTKYYFRPLQPLDGAAFFEKFPQAKDIMQEREDRRETERKRSAENLTKVMTKKDIDLTEWL